MVTPNRQSHIVALPNGNTERHGIWLVLSLIERVNLAGPPVQRTSALASADSELVNAMGATAEVAAALQRSRSDA